MRSSKYFGKRPSTLDVIDVVLMKLTDFWELPMNRTGLV